MGIKVRAPPRHLYHRTHNPPQRRGTQRGRGHGEPGRGRPANPRSRSLPPGPGEPGQPCQRTCRRRPTHAPSRTASRGPPCFEGSPKADDTKVARLRPTATFISALPVRLTPRARPAFPGSAFSVRTNLALSADSWISTSEACDATSLDSRALTSCAHPPPPAAPPRQVTGAQAGCTDGCTLDSAAHVKPEQAANPARPWLSVESRRCTPTALTARTPVRYMSVDTATQRSTALQGDTRRDKKKTARLTAFPQPAGRFPRVWQVLGSNQRRLSRRFYRPPVFRPSAGFSRCAYATGPRLSYRQSGLDHRSRRFS